MSPTFELIMPAYNEAASLDALLSRTVAAAENMGLSAREARLVVVNNGSTDASAQQLAALAQGSHAPWLRVVTVAENKGYGHGLWAGLSSSQAPYVGWTHADQQCDPKDAFVALQRLQAASGPTLVKGSRHGRAAKERFVSKTFATCAKLLLRMPLEEINAQPKVLPRALLSHLPRPPDDFFFDLYVLYHAVKRGYAIDEIAVAFPARKHGMSRWAASLAGRYKTILRMIGSMAQLSWREGRLPKTKTGR